LKEPRLAPRLFQLGGEEKSPYACKCIMVLHMMLDATPTPGGRTINVFYEPFLIEKSNEVRIMIVAA
jgi:hypothetical protein